MSNPFASGPNPYASPSAVPPTAEYSALLAFKPIDRIEHWRMYTYLFESPNWLVNLLLTALCCVIPVVGPLVMIGYQFEIVTALLWQPGTRYPDFSFGRFSDYLIRGLWPFLVQLVASVVLTPVLIIVLLIPIMLVIGLAAAAGDDAAPTVMLAIIPVMVLAMVLASVAFTMLVLPLMVRAGLAEDFSEGFNFSWAIDFLRKTWKEAFIALLFLMLTASVLAFVGVLACYVGIFAVMPLIFLAQAHLYYQLYVLYLSRGGTPILSKTQYLQPSLAPAPPPFPPKPL